MTDYRFDFRGAKLDAEEKQGIEEHLRNDFTPRLVDGEKTKTSEQLALINDIASFITAELRDLGLDEDVNIEPDRVHFLDEQSYTKSWSEAPANAHYDVYKHQIYVNLDAKKLHDYKVLIHEFLHMVSPKKWWVETRPSAADPGAKDYRIKKMKNAYLISNESRTDDVYHEHFRGFNELVTEKLAKDIFDKNEKYFFRFIKATSNQIAAYRQTEIAYDYYIEIFDNILRYISQRTGEPRADMWKRYKRGYFTNSVMQLREIEKFLGKGSLRILASIESGSKLEFEALVPKIYEYFTSTNQDVRSRIAQEILSDEEFQMYLKQVR